MSKVAILGSTGMIGSGVTKALHEIGHDVTQFNRKGLSTIESRPSNRFEILDVLDANNFDFLQEYEFVINFTGFIRHKIDDESQEHINTAIKINSIFPRVLDRGLSQFNSVRVFHLGTDCVFSGRKGAYIEQDRFDPIDVYGFTKALGEFGLSNSQILRVSVIGVEQRTSIEFLNWVLRHSQGSSITGYVNHFWNGITPLHLARILSGIMKSKTFQQGVQHVVPEDTLSKYELAKLVKDSFGRKDLNISKHVSLTSVDRTLGTSDFAKNDALWRAAGYLKPPRIKDMIVEYADWVSSNNMKPKDL